MLNEIWKIWHQDYLREVVIIYEEGISRRCWKLGKVLELKATTDGKISKMKNNGNLQTDRAPPL